VTVVRLEGRIARLLALGTYASVVALLVGTLAWLLDPAGTVGGGGTAALAIGLVIVILTPVARVVAAAVGFATRGERELAAISLAVLAILALSVVVAGSVG
jgi:uncharacterized membrane protein